jgi:hypothetical protein
VPGVDVVPLHGSGHLAMLEVESIDPRGEARFDGAGEGAVDEGEHGAIDPVQFDCPERSMVWANVDVSFAGIEPPE